MDFFKNPLKFFPKFDLSKKEAAFSHALDGLVRHLVLLDQDCKKIDENVNGFLANLRFATIGGGQTKLGILGTNASDWQSKIAELIEILPQFSSKKEKFSVEDSVEEFLKYAEKEGRQFFEELDRDKDGQVSLEDLEVALSKRRLPRSHARKLMQCCRKPLFSRSIGWKQFLFLMEQKDLAILKAYTTLCLNKSGAPQKGQIMASLRIAGVLENEENMVALMHHLNVDNGQHISYGDFRNFMLLLPSRHVKGDPRNKCCEAASTVSVSQPVGSLAEDILKSALAGGIACSFSAFVMHPVDTIKTCVQASTLSLPELVSKMPEFGLQGMYKGSIPAVVGQFSSHGLRTGLCEAGKFALTNAIPGLPEIQVQSLASFCSTVLGTASRVPCEVLKQRLQAGIFDNVGEATVVTWHQDGMKGFFRGTGAMLCREIPFYVLGAGLYEETKKAIQKLIRRDLEPWETVAVGAVTGGLASVLTTPFDVIKTRMMTAPQGTQLSMQIAALTIIREEGSLALFRGAVPRFFWVAPLGAMNFAGYELLRKAMDRMEFLSGNRKLEKQMADKT